MLRKLAILSLVLLSSSAMAKTLDTKAADAKVADQAPDCSADSDGRIYDALMVSFENKGLHNYTRALLGTDAKNLATDKFELLSSERISKAEQKRLMLRRAKKDHTSDLNKSGLSTQYMDEPLYRQYYKVTSNKGLKAIAEFYAAPGACAVDLESIYIIADQLEGFTPNFADR
jgi:hypothetical protein